jgi:hypothetical protein
LDVVVVFSFFISVFSTIVWAIYSIANILDSLKGMPFSSLSLQEAALQILTVAIPVFVIWTIFGHVFQFTTTRSLSSSMSSLFKQMKKNQDYTDLIVRVLLEAEHELKDGFVLNRFDLFIADINELLSDIIYLANIASNDQIDNLWRKVQNGGKWAFGKVIIEVNGGQPNFSIRLFEKSRSNIVLAGSILEFCARYGSLVDLLEKHDKNRVFLNIVETGVLGKTFSIIAPIADEVRKSREVPKSAKIHDPEVSGEEVPQPRKIYNPEAEPDRQPSIISKLNVFKKKESPGADTYFEEDTRFSAVLERSFGRGGAEEAPAPKFGPAEEDAEPATGIVIEPKREEFGTSTQKALHSLKKEWEEMKREDGASYPFSGWADEENYQK